MSSASNSNSPASTSTPSLPAFSTRDGSRGRAMISRIASSEALNRPQASSSTTRLGEGRLIERRRASTLSDAPDRKRRFRVVSGPGGFDGVDGSRRTGSGIGDLDCTGFSSRDNGIAASGMAVATGSGSGSGTGSSSTAPIDLTASSPPRRSLNDHHRLGNTPWSAQGTDYMEYFRPRWQPDEEVTECPICEVAFSFWYRKHHCRKCGRVVCASCSPHRITIPRQYIVRPPDVEGGVSAAGAAGLVSARASQVIDLESHDIPAVSPSAANPALGGGEEVRLCNPCVPDPNPEPPRVFVQPNPPRHRSHQSMSVPRHSYGALGEGPRQGRRTVGSNDYPCFGFGNLFGGSYQDHQMRFSSGAQHRPLPPDPSTRPSRPRRIVNERDLCPICNSRFPPLPENGDETPREAHIRDCIENHGARVRSSSQTQPRNEAQPDGGSPATQPPVLPVRMVAFTATEKDCLDHGEGSQECTICMEEYEVGEPLVRLECLCKFHKRCIVEWFERKKECPMHKVS